MSTLAKNLQIAFTVLSERHPAAVAAHGEGMQAALSLGYGVALMEGMDREELTGFTAAAQERLARPAPVELRPARQDFPKPADFEDEIIIGHIHGEPVRGLQGWDTVVGTATRYVIACDLNGLHLLFDGENVEIGSHGAQEGLPLRDVAALAELWQSGAVQQLTAIARRWVSGAPALTTAAA